MTNEANWVLARANCTLDDTFDKVTKQMESDANAFNNLSAEIRKDRLFGSHYRASGTFDVFPAYEDEDDGLVEAASADSISVKKSSTYIVAARNLHDPLKITPKWNEDTLSCDLLITGKPLPIWAISQRILGDFFFG